MARISPKPISNYPWYLRLLYRFQRKKYGAPLDPALLWGRTSQVFLSFLFMQKAFNRKRSPLNPILRALITVRVSQVNQCAFCIDMNSALLLQRGGSEDKIPALSQFRKSPIFSDSEKIALEYTEVVTQNADKVSDELFNRLKKHYDEDAIVELTALIAFQNLSSRFNAALDVAAFGFCKTEKAN
jgi:AhpD family alkylhydroperoxidase